MHFARNTKKLGDILKKLSCHTLIIGAGSAGLEAYRAASNTGVSCILVESGPLGTTSQRTGDVPASLLMAAAKGVSISKNLDKFGVQALGEQSFDTSDVMNSLRALRARGTTEILSIIYKIPERNRVIGCARFIDTKTVEIIDKDIEITFDTAVIATGSTPAIPFEIGKLGDILTTSELFDLDSIPKSIAVFGSGAEALQLGQALSYLGSDVTVFSKSNFWHFTDESVIQVATDEISSKVKIAFNSLITAIDREDGYYGLYYIDDSNYENYLRVQKVLSVNMRVAKTQGLNLRNIGVNLDHKGFISVDNKTMQTSVNNIFACGNITDEFTSTVDAKYQGFNAGLNAATYPLVNVVAAPYNIKILDTDPPMAIVGLNLENMKKRSDNGHPFIVSESRTNGGLYRIKRATNGIIRLYIDERSHKILGSEMCLEGASHIAQFLLLCIKNGMTCDELAKYPFYNPTFEQILNDVALSATKTLSRKKVL